MKHSSDTTGNRTRDLPACSAVSQLTAPPHGTYNIKNGTVLFEILRVSGRTQTELHLLVYRETVWRIESKERSVKASVLRDAEHRFRSCYNRNGVCLLRGTD